MDSSQPSDTTDGPSYCSSCGSPLEPDDSFCSDCGTPVGSPSPGQAQQNADQEFRERVNHYLTRGWEVQYDAGDEVALVDRDFGSIGVHLILFFVSGGLLNALYGWYHYSKSSDRVVIRKDGNDAIPNAVAPPAATSTTSRQSSTQTAAGGTATGGVTEHRTNAQDDSSVGHYIIGIGLVLLGVFTMLTGLGNLGAMMWGLGFLLSSLVVLPPARKRLRDRHPPTTFGPTETVDAEPVSHPNQLCSVCQTRIEDGVHREYEKEYVLAGVPLYTIDAGDNWYCESCHQERYGIDTDYTRVNVQDREEVDVSDDTASETDFDWGVDQHEDTAQNGTADDQWGTDGTWGDDEPTDEQPTGEESEFEFGDR